MKHLSKKINIVATSLILFFVSSIVIILCGSTYTISCDANNKNIDNIEDVSITIEDGNIIEFVDKSLENNVVKVKIKSKSIGKTSILISDPKVNLREYYFVYVHRLGIISFNEYMGNTSGSIIIPISITIWLIYTLYLLIISYKQSMKESMYQYKNIVYIGIIVFVVFSIIEQGIEIFNYNGLINTINRLSNSMAFALYLFPITFVVSILVVISNIVLIRKEGFNIRNMLGVFLGVFLCLLTVLPDFLYNSLSYSSWIDVHNQNGFGVYLYNFVESSIFLTVTYIECILLGTIIMGIKSAKHIPSFDKDYIIILGCQIKKDGSLTNLLKNRVNRAIEFGKMQKESSGKDIVYVPSGGKGDDESISEGLAIKKYLVEQGINEEQILVEDSSKNTNENIKFSNEIICSKNKNAKVAFSTTNYHVFRAGNIAFEQDLKFEGIGAKTKPYFWINAFIREFVATLISEKKKHVIVILCILSLIILLQGIIYLNNVI